MFIIFVYAFQIKDFVFNFQLYVYVWGYVHVISGASGVQKKELDLLEMELQVVVHHAEWVLRAGLSFSAWEVYVINLCSSSTFLDFYGG